MASGVTGAMKVALITGASSGIGRATAIKLATNRYQLSLTGRNKQTLRETKDLCLKAAGQTLRDTDILTMSGDVKDTGFLQTLTKTTIDTFGKLDVLVNNAGRASFDDIEDASLELFDDVMNVNVRSVYYLTHLCAKHLIASKGNIVNVSSINGLKPFESMVTYSVSKAALEMFSKTIALSLGPKGVRVNSVCPGKVNDTDITRDIYDIQMEREVLDAALEAEKSIYPLRRHAEVREVSDVIAWLVSDQASFVHGASIPIEGGFLNVTSSVSS